MRLRPLVLLFLSACSAANPPAVSSVDADADGARAPRLDAPPASTQPPRGATFVLTNVRRPGGERTELFVEGGRVVEASEELASAPRIDGGDAFVVPAVIDAHVHFAYLPAHEEHAEGGVAGAVDLACPIDFLEVELDPLRLRRAGPMITAPGGYPTRSWGADGYGLSCADPDACGEAVGQLDARGVDLIKVPLTAEPTLGDDALRAVVSAAHERGLLVAAHALSDEAAARAAAAGVDVLAHTPTAALSEATVNALSGVTVISTLSAFGGSATAVDNLARLRRAGATVVYGTDFGNSRAAGIDRRELRLLLASGLDEQAILDGMTRIPAEVFGFDALGSLEPGKVASFLLTDADPQRDILTLAAPAAVYLDGVRR